MKEHIRHLIEQALDQLRSQQRLPNELRPEVRVERTKDKGNGDYASNIAMVLSKPAAMRPRDLAALLVESLPSDPTVSRVEIAGPGFINFFQNHDALAHSLDQALMDSKLTTHKKGAAQKVVLDLSSPNLAKEMHVGHLRSTIIGDAVARVLEYLGDKAIRQNHVGDWGTQFGMLLAYLKENPLAGEQQLSNLESFYRAAKKRFDEDADFAQRARAMVVALQAGDEECLTLWRHFNDISLSHCQQVYDQLDVKLTPQDVFGESAYNAMLPEVIHKLAASGLLTESQGAKCVFLEGYRTPEDTPLPMIVQKADGGYLYTTTDLAAILYRCQTLHVDRILYFVDQRQALHFQMLFDLVRLAGFAPASVELEHMGFGTMNGSDGKPFKTRDGGTVKLADLLREAEERAYALTQEKNPDFDETELRRIAHAIGIGAVKYADLSKHRTSDYNFNFEQMLSLTGNTAPYLLYAYARVASLLRKAGVEASNLPGHIQLEDAFEENLASHLLQFSDILNAVAEKGLPHLLCGYLYTLAGLFSSFYENCPILDAQQTQKESRLRLAALTGRVLKQGLELLGLTPLERM